MRTTNLALLVSFLALAATFAACQSARAQGALTPPGAPAPTMKSLGQIEPRTPVDTVHTPGDSLSVFIITQPGSYYLTTNVLGPSGKNGIAFLTNDITLDLNGFALIGSGAGNGIATPVGLTNFVIRNGTIRKWNLGIDTTANRNTLIENVLAVQNSSTGINLGSESTARNCKALGNAGNGISAEANSLIMDCTASWNAGSGFVVNNDSVVENCLAEYNGSAGILGNGSRARIDGDHCGNNNYGVQVLSGGNNVVIRNTLIGNTNDIAVPGGNKVGPIVSDPANSSANSWANIVTSLIF